MRVVSTGELRKDLSDALDAVVGGEEILVTRHGRPVARLVPLDAGSRSHSAVIVEDPPAPYGGSMMPIAADRAVTTDHSGLFPSAGVRAVLSLFVLHPGREFYQREVARLARVPLRSAQLALARLEGLGLIESRPSGNRVHYQTVRSVAFEGLKTWALPEVALMPALREALVPLADDVEFAFVYGSTAQGTYTATSDIDLMVVGVIGSAELFDALALVEEALGKVVNVTLYTAEEFDRRVAERAHFISAVLDGPRLWVVGEDRAAQHGAA
jgi:prevent-host-death family protein